MIQGTSTLCFTCNKAFENFSNTFFMFVNQTGINLLSKYITRSRPIRYQERLRELDKSRVHVLYF